MLNVNVSYGIDYILNLYVGIEKSKKMGRKRN